MKKFKINIEKLSPKQAFYTGIISSVGILGFFGTTVLLNIKYNKPFEGLLAPVIGIITIYIIWQQQNTSKHKLKIDLYEKRFKVFESIRDLLIEIQREADSKDPKKYYNFIINSDDANFLFEEDIINYTKKIREKISKLKLINSQLNNPQLGISEERTKLAYENSNILGWFHNELQKNMRKRFYRYLNINKLK